MRTTGTVKAAVVQGRPCLFDLQGAVEKTVGLIHRAAETGAKLILFPEAFVGGYPFGMNFGVSLGLGTDGGKRDFARYYENCLQLPEPGVQAPEAERIAAAARETETYVVLGCVEKTSRNATLYCTAAFWGPDGTFLGKHRKIKPTTTERTFWGEGDGSTLPAVETPYGRMGALICWENYLPLLRAAMYGKGLSFYLAPTMDFGPEWLESMRHIARESRCFVLTANTYCRIEDFPKDLNSYYELAQTGLETVPGSSCIIDPFGHELIEPIVGREDIGVAELDLGLLARARLNLDVSGHYSRPDILQLVVDERPKELTRYEN